MQLPKTLSQSRINNFLNCPAQWLFDYQKRPQIETDISAREFGSNYHLVIKCYYTKIDDFPTDKEIDEKLNEAMVEVGNNYLDENKAKTKKVRDNFIAHEKRRVKKREPKPTFTERYFTTKIWDDIPAITAVIDYYTEPLKRGADWKTGAERELSDAQYIQGGLYILTLNRNNYPVDQFLFHYLETGNSPVLPRVTEGWIYNKIKGVCDCIERDYFPAKPSGLCSWCPWILCCKFRKVCFWSL